MLSEGSRQAAPFIVLSLDGGGSKGVYTLGVLHELERQLGCRLSERFDLVFGTSTGSIIGSMIALGYSIEEIKKRYFEIIPRVMKPIFRAGRSRRLRQCAAELLGKHTFADFTVPVGLVATRLDTKRPLIFKSQAKQAYSRHASFLPGFGCTVAEAVLASSAAFPYFEKVELESDYLGNATAMDGGFVANNPTLLAIAEATRAFACSPERMRVLSLGVGHYNEPQGNPVVRWVKRLWPLALAQQMFECNSNTIEQLRMVLYPEIRCVRVDEAYTDPQFATDLLESDIKKLDRLFVLGRESFGKHQQSITSLFTS